MKKADLDEIIQDWKQVMTENSGDRLTAATLLTAYHLKRVADVFEEEAPEEHDPTFDKHPTGKTHKTKH